MMAADRLRGFLGVERREELRDLALHRLLDEALREAAAAAIERVTDWIADNSNGDSGGYLADRITARFLDAEAAKPAHRMDPRIDDPYMPEQS